MSIDVLIEIHYDINDVSKTVIYTNARTDNGALTEVLENWILDQAGRGRDPAKPNDRAVYKIKIGLVLEDDSFCTESDTGNTGLTCGIVLDVFQHLKSISVKTLSERPQEQQRDPEPAP